MSPGWVNYSETFDKRYHSIHLCWWLDHLTWRLEIVCLHFFFLLDLFFRFPFSILDMCVCVYEHIQHLIITCICIHFWICVTLSWCQSFHTGSTKQLTYRPRYYHHNSDAICFLLPLLWNWMCVQVEKEFCDYRSPWNTVYWGEERVMKKKFHRLFGV